MRGQVEINFFFPILEVPFFHFECSCTFVENKKEYTAGGTRTHNPWLRRPMPYPLGHSG